jgi:CheY-like chemotaxis protein
MGTRVSGLKLLLVDDDPADRALFALALERLPHLKIRLLTVADGEEAIRYLQGKLEYADRALYPMPEAIVLDLRMTIMDGLDFLAWQKAHPEFACLPVITFSGTQDPKEEETALALGAVAHVEKPCDFGKWTAAVGRVCELACEHAHLAAAETLSAAA